MLCGPPILTGIGEVVLLPLDVLKIKRQVNPEAFRGRGIIRIIAEENTALYRGWGWTMARNAPGSFALFGASAVTKDYVLGVTDYSQATWTQNFIASIAGAVASITVAAPLDTVKTRIQNANFENKVNGAVVIKDLIKNEGITAFFKGLTPKIIIMLDLLIYFMLGSFIIVVKYRTLYWCIYWSLCRAFFPAQPMLLSVPRCVNTCVSELGQNLST
ncbi:mitochondrial carrier domain-containing protein [Lentinula aciculospora]|uniref:Mitochondrial carrier domain-containing protein n=1 Tax=Lentinula aciculospora TaxID=153920 RepID=A0A9W9AT77_9AGAR|nr:mitochondrial carrier domain-containing protein [Lentinula aciculospora]